MKHIRDLAGRELKWTQPHAMERDFKLKDGDEDVATLEYRSLFGSFATALTADGSWTFKRVGFFNTRVTICVAGTDSEIAIFKNSTWNAGGSLEFPDGRVSREHELLDVSYEFRNEADEPLVQFRQIAGAFHLSSHVEITSAGAKLDELPWLVALGWYLAVGMRNDSSGAVAVAAAG